MFINIIFVSAENFQGTNARHYRYNRHWKKLASISKFKMINLFVFLITKAKTGWFFPIITGEFFTVLDLQVVILSATSGLHASKFDNIGCYGI